jgi:pimeloyl-ACP methyl ester carboxylesterase
VKINLIFLHGGPGFKDYLKDYFVELSNDFECIFYDQSRGNTIGIDDLILQLDEIILKLVGKVVLVGHSWGGVLAVEYATRFQERVHGLVLMSTGLTSKHWYDEYYKEQEVLGLNEAPMEEIFLAEDEQVIGKPLLEFGEKTWSEETFISLDDSYLRKYDLIQSFSELKIPIINVFGEKDVRFPRRVTSSFKNYNQGVIELEIKGAGHFPFLKENGKNKIHTIIKKTF